ncbi:ribonuclease H-like YkuK family protein [Candidatus Parcubacteria bacterium]|nr:ribonuclease H-like YkuK family protein [Candidatus Parcubacteria bacterium]
MKETKLLTKEEVKQFVSPTWGRLDLQGVIGRISSYMGQESEAKYRVIIGTDSQTSHQRVEFVTALIVHRLGAGGIYFWRRWSDSRKFVLRSRIYEEAFSSLKFAQEFMDESSNNGIWNYDLEIHVDIGRMGETRTLINEVVGMIRGSGFNVRIKPEAYGAATVADRHT